MKRARRLWCRLTSHRIRTFVLTDHGVSVLVDRCSRCGHTVKVQEALTNRRTRRAKKTGRALPPVMELKRDVPA